MNQNLFKAISLALFAAIIVCCLPFNSLAQDGNRLAQGQPVQEPDFGLLRKGEAIPDVDVVLKKKPGGNAAGNARTDHEGNFYLGYLTPGVYSLTLNISTASASQFDAQMAKTYTDSKSNTGRAMVMLDGVKSMAVISSLEMQRNRFFGQSAPAFTQVYEIQFEVVGRQAVTGNVSIVIDEAGVK